MNDVIAPPSFDPLPSGPLLSRFVLEQPLLPAIALLLVAIGVLLVQNRTGRLGARSLWALAPVALAGGVLAAGSLVQTERELLRERTRELIGAAADADTDRLRGLLAEDVSLEVSGAIARVLQRVSGREDMLSAVDARLERQYPIEDWSVYNLQASLDGPGVARTQLRVRVEIRGSLAHGSIWRLHWERDGDGPWRCFELEPMWIQGVGSFDG
ncbi:MAG: hypothetical protein AAFX79_04080 [Planctomycetota bacterium]